MGKKAYHYCCFDKTKPKPKWLTVQGLACHTSWVYWNRLWDAQPVWADTDQIKRIYKRAARLRDEGFDAVVDHIIPLRGERICGFHIPENLQIITRPYNSQISNHSYPGCNHRQLDMFGIPSFMKRPWGEEFEQFELNMFGNPWDHVK